MKPTTDTTATPESAIAAPIAPAGQTPKEPQTKTITLTANGSTMQLVAVRLREGASTYVTTTVDGSKKNIRGMSVTHESWADALASLVVSAAKAEKMGW